MNRHQLPFSAHIVAVLPILTLLLFSIVNGTPHADANQLGSAEVSLGVIAQSNVACSPAVQPDSCMVELGTRFTVVASLDSLPPEGFSGFQVEVVQDGLASKDARYVVTGFNTFGVHGVGTESIKAGGITSFTPPIPVSTYLGPLVEVDLTCSTSPGTFHVSLPVPTTDLLDQVGNAIPITTVTHGSNKVADALTVHCSGDPLPPAPAPLDLTDTDGDGCSDQQENGADEMRGGMRDYENPNDYYDTNGDAIIDLANDILGVVLHYAPSGLEPVYDVDFDRGPTAGPNAWNMTAPDGLIDLSNDILGSIQQYQHDCR